MDMTILKTFDDLMFLIGMATKDKDYKEEIDAVADKLWDEIQTLLIVGGHTKSKLDKMESFIDSDKEVIANLTYRLRCAPKNPASELAITETSPLHRASSDIKSIKAMQDILIKRGKIV